MTKDQFFSKLNTSLKRLPSEEREDILQDFEEHFAAGIEKGKTEEEIIISLGSPEQIAKELVAIYRVERVEESTSAKNILGAIGAVIGLGFFNLFIVLVPFILFAAIIISGWIVAVSFIASPLLVVINILIYPQIFAWFDIFLSIGLAGIGLFVAIGMYFVSRSFAKGFIRYLKYNIRMVKGGMGVD